MVVTSSSGGDEDVEASSRRMSNARSFESLKRHARQSASTAEAESINVVVGGVGYFNNSANIW